MQRPALFSRSTGGHRGSFLDFTERELDGVPVSSGLVGQKAPVLFLMIDDGFGHYAVTAIMRAILNRRTVGFLFRPKPAIESRSAKQRLKRTILKFLKIIPAIQTLTIVPIPLDPRFEEIADGWVHDFQLWDMSDEDRAQLSALQAGAIGQDEDAVALFQTARAQAQGRKILAAIGSQNQDKGFDMLAAAPRIEDWMVMITGRVAKDQAKAKTVLEARGAFIADRFVSDVEILATYAAADAVWCFYDPAYDQASGIMGRALQFGIPFIVREGSLMHALCRAEAVPHMACQNTDDLAALLAALPPAQPTHGQQLATRFRAESLGRLRQALGIVNSV